MLEELASQDAEVKGWAGLTCFLNCPRERCRFGCFSCLRCANVKAQDLSQGVCACVSVECTGQHSSMTKLFNRRATLPRLQPGGAAGGCS